MKTEVSMERRLFGCPISQKSKSEFFSATELVKAGNKWRRENNLSDFNLSQWLKKQTTKEFIAELDEKYSKSSIIKSRGRNSQTWTHPLLFIDIALAISPTLKIEVYEWLFDQLIKNRNKSGDSYKNMCGALYVRHGHKRTFPNYISKVAKEIKAGCKVENDWQKATEEQLQLRDKIHYDITLLAGVLNNNDEAVRLGFVQNNIEKTNGNIRNTKKMA